jgi:hypothetical protein
MSNAFEYRPKFVDIRVKKGVEARVREQIPDDAPACDHVGCDKAGRHKAPKSRDRAGEFWHFCVAHAAEYNRRWNYFDGMSDDELADHRRREETGHRPTWNFRTGRLDRNSGAMRGGRGGRVGDPFGLFGAEAGAAPPTAAPKRRLTRLQALCLEVLALDEGAGAAEIRTRYAELVKRWHPDSNGGDRSAETNLQRVIKAYQTLKAAGFV